jgi:hypothetical protein
MSIAATAANPPVPQSAATQAKPAISAQMGIALGSFCSVMEAIGGMGVVNPAMDLALHVPADAPSSSSATITDMSGDTEAPVTGMPTTALIASQIVQAMGDDGQISLSDVEKIMAATPQGAVANSMANVDADFKALSGGSGILSENQLTAGIQAFMNEGGFTNAYHGGGSMIVNGVVAGPVTGAFPAAGGSIPVPPPWETDESKA